MLKFGLAVFVTSLCLIGFIFDNWFLAAGIGCLALGVLVVRLAWVR